MYKRIKDGTHGDKIAWHTIPAIISEHETGSYGVTHDETVSDHGDSLNSVNQTIRNRYL